MTFSGGIRELVHRKCWSVCLCGVFDYPECYGRIDQFSRNGYCCCSRLNDLMCNIQFIFTFFSNSRTLQFSFIFQDVVIMVLYQDYVAIRNSVRTVIVDVQNVN